MPYDSFPPHRLVHDTYFGLADRRPKTREVFLSSLQRYLSPARHRGMVEFRLSCRAVEMKRRVNDREFDVLMHMVFEDLEAYNKYRESDPHNEWIDLYGSLSSDRRVFDSYETTASDEHIARKDTQ